MRKKEFLRKSLLLGTLSLALAACSKDGIMDGEPGTTLGEGTPKLTIAVNTPASEGVVVRSAQTRADEVQTNDEKAIKSVNVYVFKKKTDAVSDAETEYLYYTSKSFNSEELENGTGETKECSIDIDNGLSGATVKVAVIANDKPASPTLTQGSTTLEDFRKVLATAAVNTDDYTNKLVGDVGEENSTGFPMSWVSTDGKTLATHDNVIDAKLFRTVARLDIENKTTNLSVTGVTITGVNDKSYLLRGSTDGVHVPNDVQKIGLKVLNAFETLLTPDGWAYNAEDNKKTFAYLYEQSVTDATSSPKITIDYKLKVSTNPDKFENGKVDVYFQKTSDSKDFVNVTRNNLYTIVLGNGDDVNPGKVVAKFVVSDWEKGDEINGGLKPGEDSEEQQQ